MRKEVVRSSQHAQINVADQLFGNLSRIERRAGADALDTLLALLRQPANLNDVPEK